MAKYLFHLDFSQNNKYTIYTVKIGKKNRKFLRKKNGSWNSTNKFDLKMCL